MYSTKYDVSIGQVKQKVLVLIESAMKEADELLLVAAEAGNLDGVKAAIAAGADINVQNEFWKQTALQYAELFAFRMSSGSKQLCILHPAKDSSRLSSICWIKKRTC